MTVTVDEAKTGEIVLSEKQARKLTDEIRKDIESLWPKVIKAFQGMAHKALGYTSWDAYCSAEFDSDYLRVPRSERSEVVGMLRSAGMSTRAIAASVGVDQKTVCNDLAATEENSSVEITGVNGKTYAVARRPAPLPGEEGCRVTDPFAHARGTLFAVIKAAKEHPEWADNKKTRDIVKKRCKELLAIIERMEQDDEE